MVQIRAYKYKNEMADPCFPGSVAPYQLSYFTSAFSALLTVVIAIGNLLIIIAVARDPLRKLRNPFAYFLANAAVSDLMVGVVAMPVSTMFHYMEAKQKINKDLIYVLHLTYFVSASASLFSMAAMAIDRYYALMSITTKRRKFSARRCILISIVIWLLAAAFSGVYFALGYVTLLVIYINISLVSSFGITLLTYRKVIRKMRYLNETLIDRNYRGTEVDGPAHHQKPPKRDRHIKQEHKVTIVFLSLLITFLCIYIPATISVYILQFCLSFNCSTRHVFRDMVFLLVSCSSATNPIVCVWKLPIIRKSLHAVIRCKKQQIESLSQSFDRTLKETVTIYINNGTIMETHL